MSVFKKDVRYKARLVVKGYVQKEGAVNEVFSLVVKDSSIRILLTLVAQLNLELFQLDVKNVLLHGDLEEEIYFDQFKLKKKYTGSEHMIIVFIFVSHQIRLLLSSIIR